MDDLITLKQKHLNKRMARTNIHALRAMASMQRRAVPFLTTIGSSTALIGQVCYEMPRTNDLSTIYDPVLMAQRYVDAGADAIGLFTDTVIEYDGAQDMTLIADAMRLSKTPVIHMDYVLDEYHVVEARAAGASVVVLYSDLVPPEQLRQLTSAVHRNLMTAVIQVFNRTQLESALQWSPQVIGLGAMSPLDLEVHMPTITRLRKAIPNGQQVMIPQPLRTLDAVRAALALNLSAITVDQTLMGELKTVEALHRILART